MVNLAMQNIDGEIEKVTKHIYDLKAFMKYAPKSTHGFIESELCKRRVRMKALLEEKVRFGRALSVVGGLGIRIR